MMQCTFLCISCGQPNQQIVILFDSLKTKQYEIIKDISLLDVRLNMNLEIKLQKGMKGLENDSMHLYSS